MHGHNPHNVISFGDDRCRCEVAFFVTDFIEKPQEPANPLTRKAIELPGSIVTNAANYYSVGVPSGNPLTVAGRLVSRYICHIKVAQRTLSRLAAPVFQTFQE